MIGALVYYGARDVFVTLGDYERSTPLTHHNQSLLFPAAAL